MAKKLKELSGKFNADGKYNLAEYNLYLNSLVLSVKQIQNALYTNMQNAQNITNDTTKQIKAALSTNYVKGGGEKEYKGDWDPNMRPDDISNWNLVN